MPTFDTPEPIAVDLEIGVGDVRIVAADRADTVVEVRPSDPTSKGDVTAAEQTRVEYAGGRLVVKAPKGWKQWAPWGGGESLEVQIELPAGSQVRGETGVAALHCMGRLGECCYRTGVGDIEIDQAGPVELKTGGGDVSVEHATDRAEVVAGFGTMRIGRLDGTAVIKHASGDTWIGQVTGDLRVSAANGSIAIDRADATIEARTPKGDVRLGEVIRGSVVAESRYGRIEVGVRDGVAAWLDLEARHGRVRSDFEAARGPEPGQETVEVRARTSYGDITISRRIPTGMEEVS
jgi:hypothetical protein